MSRGRIIYDEQRNTGRRWAVAAGFAVAAAAGLYTAFGTDNPSEQKPDISNQKESATREVSHREVTPHQVWGHVAEMGANGQQKPTNDMWGLLLRAQNEASQARHEEDISYSKELGEEGCKTFWVAHMNYQNMRAATDPVSKLDYYLYMPLRFADFLASRDYNPAYSPSLDMGGHGAGALTELLRGAIPELKERLRQNPQDTELHEKYAQARFLAGQYQLKIPDEWLLEGGYEYLKETLRLPILRKALETLTLPPPVDLTTLEADSYVNHARRLAHINSNDDVTRLMREALNLTPQQADILAIQAANVTNEQLRQHTVKMQQYTKDHNAPCPY